MAPAPHDTAAVRYPGYFERETGAPRLTYVANVSWPRSGHELLVNLLRRALGGSFGYCEYYVRQRLPQVPCCGRFPCTKTDVIAMTKMHDLDFNAELTRDHPLIVQHRAFTASLVSHFDMMLTHGRIEDTRAAFVHFGKRRAPRYRRFVEKWIAGERTNRVVLRYEDLIADPSAAMRRVAPLFGARLDEECLAAALSEVATNTISADTLKQSREPGVRQRRRTEDFRYYDAPLFAELEAEARAGG